MNQSKIICETVEELNSRLIKREASFADATSCATMMLARQQERTANALERIADKLETMHTKTDVFNCEIRGNITNEY